jgi:hypothetical protein
MTADASRRVFIMKIEACSIFPVGWKPASKISAIGRRCGIFIATCRDLAGARWALAQLCARYVK